MDTDAQVTRLRQWARLVDEAEASGNKADWCRERGIPYKTYFNWQRHVRSYIREHGENSLDADNDFLPTGVPGRTDLVDVTSSLRAKAARPSNPAPALQPELMIQYGDFQLFIGNDITESALATVLKVIRNA